jgi:hypothetical protein
MATGFGGNINRRQTERPPNWAAFLFLISPLQHHGTEIRK